MSNDNALGSPGSDKEWKEHFEAQEVVITGHKLAESFLKDRIAALEDALKVEADENMAYKQRIAELEDQLREYGTANIYLRERIAELEELLKAKISNLHTSKIAELEATIKRVEKLANYASVTDLQLRETLTGEANVD